MWIVLWSASMRIFAQCSDVKKLRMLRNNLNEAVTDANSVPIFTSAFRIFGPLQTVAKSQLLGVDITLSFHIASINAAYQLLHFRWEKADCLKAEIQEKVSGDCLPWLNFCYRLSKKLNEKRKAVRCGWKTVAWIQVFNCSASMELIELGASEFYCPSSLTFLSLTSAVNCHVFSFKRCQPTPSVWSPCLAANNRLRKGSSARTSFVLTDWRSP